MVTPYTGLFSQQTKHSTWRGGVKYWRGWVQYICFVRCRLPPLDGYVAVCLVLTKKFVICMLWSSWIQPHSETYPNVECSVVMAWSSLSRKKWTTRSVQMHGLLPHVCTEYFCVCHKTQQLITWADTSLNLLLLKR